MSDYTWQFIIGVFILAIVFMLVRPGSPAGTAIGDVSKALSGLIRTATDYTASSTTQGQ